MEYMMKRLILSFMFILILTFAQAQNYEIAKEYYFNGLKYYRNGNYEMAEICFQRALELSPTLESEIPEIKMYLGLSAFQNKNYKIAGVYLENFRGNVYVDQILEILETIDMENDRQIVKVPASEQQESTVIEKREEDISFSLFLVVEIIIFSITCLTAVLTFLWLRRYKKPLKIYKNQTPIDNLSSKMEEIQPTKVKIKTLNEFEEESVKQILKGSKNLLKLLNIDLDPESGSAQSSREKEREELSEIDRLQKEIEDTLQELLHTANVSDIEMLLFELKEEEVLDVEKSLTSREKKETQKVEKEYQEVKGFIQPDEETRSKFNLIMNTKQKELFLKKYDRHDIVTFKENIRKEQQKANKNDLEEFFNLLFNETNYEKLKNQNIDF